MEGGQVMAMVEARLQRIEDQLASWQISHHQNYLLGGNQEEPAQPARFKEGPDLTRAK